jgi:hypothetical protein
MSALKIMAKEQPSELAKLVGSLCPKQMEVDAPSLIVVATGVPRMGDVYEPRAPQIPAANPLPALPVKEGDDANDD